MCDEGEGLRPAGVETTATVSKAAGFRRRKRARARELAFVARLAYHGPSFAGFAWNASCDGGYDENAFVPGKVSVTAALQAALRPVLDKRRAAPWENIAGWRGGELRVVLDEIGRGRRGHRASRERESARSRARAWRMSETRVVESSFHATFAAKARKMVYIIPKRQMLTETRTPIAELDAEIVNRILAPLVTIGRAVDMHAFARGTPRGIELGRGVSRRSRVRG